MTRVEADRPLVDVRDMIVVHTAMLRELRLAPAAVRRTAVGDAAQAAVVAAHLRFVAGMLHHHHQTEDELLWPKLLQRCDAEARPVIERGEAQHVQIDAALGRAEQHLDAWAADPGASNRDELGRALEHLHAVLREHLDLEERCLLPLAAAVLTAQEWGAIGAAGAASMSPPELALAFGMFGYEGDPSVCRQMLREAPLVPRTVLPLIAPRLYARRARRVHGTARP